MDVIPKKIHLIGVGKIPVGRYRAYVSVMRDLHPAWEVTIWDDDTALSFVKRFFPDWLQHYCAYKLPVQRADIFRIMIVYLKGGFYLDMDMQCLRTLDDLCGHSMVLGMEKMLSRQRCAELGHKYPLRIASYMFGSRPRHGFWLDFLRQAKLLAGTAIHRESDVLETTGPGLLTNVYHENASMYNDITVLFNHDQACKVACGPTSCHFGNYAAHLHVGSWRWENQSNELTDLSE